MNKSHSAWDDYIFILFSMHNNNFENIRNIHRKKFMTEEFEKLGLCYVSLFDRSDSSGTYESIIQSRLQKLSKDKVLTNIKGDGYYGIDSKEAMQKMEEVLKKTRDHFNSITAVIFQKNFIFFEKNDKEFIKIISNINHTYMSFIKYKVLEEKENIENINLIDKWIRIPKDNVAICKKEIATELITKIEEGEKLLIKLKCIPILDKIKKEKIYLQKIIEHNT